METLSRDVLPAGVRRRLSRRDGRLPAILMGELMAGMALGMVWPVLTSPPPPIPQIAMTAVQAPASMVPGVPQAPPLPIVHVPKHAPRNPFGVPQGIDASQQRPVGPPPAQPAAPAAPVPPGQQGAGAVPVRPPIYPPIYPPSGPAPAAPAPAPAPAPPAGAPALNPADLAFN